LEQTVAQINEKMKAWAIPYEELNLRFDLLEGKITLKEFKKKYDELELKKKVKRNRK
jgi:hypothetical protein